MRTEVISLWESVEAYNVEHPIADDGGERVWIYFGQYVEELPED